MRLVVQRVGRAEVVCDGGASAEIGRGSLVLVGLHRDDGPDDLDWCARKLLGLRIFSDAEGRLNRSLDDVDGELLCVPNFTLYGDCTEGRRPSFIEAMCAEEAGQL